MFRTKAIAPPCGFSDWTAVTGYHPPVFTLKSSTMDIFICYLKRSNMLFNAINEWWPNRKCEGAGRGI